MKARLLHSLVAIALVASCTTEQVPYLNTSSPTTIDVDSNGGRQTISFDTNNDWTARASDGWIQVSPSQGSSGNVSVSVTISENPTFDDRSGYVTVESSGQSARFDIKQSTKHGYQISETNFSIGSSGGSIRVPVQTNVDYTVSVDDKCKSWLSITQTKALSSGEIVIKAEKNSTYDEREGKIYVNYDSNKTTISVKQSGLEELIVNTTSFTIGNNGGDINVPISTNVDYSCNILGNATSWITVKNLKTKGIEDYKLVLTISKNESMDSRVGQVKVSGAGKESTITINQDATLGLTIQTTSYTVESEGGNVSVFVSSNTNVSYTINNNWIHFVSTKSTTTSTYTFSIDNNPATTSRQGSIKFSAGGHSVTVTINQKENDTLTITITTAGTLSSLLSTYGGNTARKLKLIGPMDTSDFNALAQCNNLVYLDMSDVEVKAMYKAPSSVKEVLLPKKLKELGAAFRNNSNLEKVTIYPTLEKIVGSFYGCTSLTTILFPNGTSLKEILADTNEKDLFLNPAYGYKTKYSGAFQNCTSLKSFTIPASVVTLDKKSFKGCTSLETIEFENGTTIQTLAGGPSAEYGYKTGFCYWDVSCGVFSECKSLKSIKIPSSVKTIEDFAFYNCSSLEKIEYGTNSQITSLGVCTFGYCTSLSTVSIPASLTKLPWCLFYRCSALNDVKFSNQSKLTTLETNSICGPFFQCDNLKTLSLPEGITSLACYSLGDVGLESITIPASVTTIEAGAFFCDETLKIVTFAKGSKIEVLTGSTASSGSGYYSTFVGCSSLKTIDASNCTSIKKIVGTLCPDSELTLFIIGTKTPPSLGGIHSGTTQLTTLVVPDGCVNTYKASSSWSGYFDDIISFSEYYK